MTTRHLPFERGVNFRDLGGYEAVDGRKVKWRKLFRCGALDLLTERDLAAVEELNIATVCDFRGADERSFRPSRLPTDATVRHLAIVPGGSHSAEEGIIALVSGRRTAGEINAVVQDIYREIARDFAPAYAEMFRHLIAAEGRPLLIHCTGGKDRTGIGAALILAALGVPEETIVHDYMLSTESVSLRRWLNELLDYAAKHHPLPRPRDELFEVIMGLWGVSPDWLHAALRAMDETAGSVDGYIRDVLGVSDADRARLQTWYLED